MGYRKMDKVRQSPEKVMSKAIGRFLIAAVLIFSCVAIAQDEQRKQVQIVGFPWVGGKTISDTIRPAQTRAVHLVFPVLTSAGKPDTLAVDWIGMHGINQQIGDDGLVWTFDPLRPDDGWRRPGKIERSGGGPLDDAVFVAERSLTTYLNYKASAHAVTLILSSSSDKSRARRAKPGRIKSTEAAIRARFPDERAPANDAVKMFFDTCVLLRQRDPSRLAIIIEKSAVLMPIEKAGPFLMGEDGIAWDVRGENYAISLSGPPYYSCRLFVRFPPQGDMFAEFAGMASQLSKGEKIKEQKLQGGLGVAFVWSEREANSGAARGTAISIEPAVQEPGEALWPERTFWVMSMGRDFMDERMIFDLPPSPRQSKK